MKFLVALALLVLAVAEAHHESHHTLRGPRFKGGHQYKYDVEFNVTSGVLGLSTQVSKTALRAELSIYSRNGKDHILKIGEVFSSGSLKSAESKDGYLRMERNSALEDRLSIPITFTLEKGEVTQYTLSPRENLESKKIKKSILRSLEMYIPEETLQKLESHSQLSIPVTYNETKDTDSGVHTTHYMITVSPYPEFPANLSVYNISRSDNFEGERYLAHKLHHNFWKQGCSEVCRKDWSSNMYAAGCPVGREPHQSPIKTSFNHEQHLSLEHNEIMNPEIILTTEAHVAQLYDQDMEVLIKYQMKRKTITQDSIAAEPSGQQTYTDLHDTESEINEREINDLCHYKTSAEAASSVKRLLREVADLVVSGDAETQKSNIVGEKVILLKHALARLSVPELEDVAKIIVGKSSIRPQDYLNSAMRQIWIDMLPLIGTEESVTFIVEYIKSNKDSLMTWEAKEILEALPQNIHRPSEKNIRELRTLITDDNMIQRMKKYHMLHSAAHLTLARVIGDMCGSIDIIRSQPIQKPSWFSNYRLALRSMDDVSSSPYGPIKCPQRQVTEIVTDITQKLKRTENKQEIAVYLETLGHIAVPEVLPTMAQYVYGFAENIQKYGPRYIDFVQTVSLYALHNVAEKHPEEVLQIALPVFFNETEVPRVRTAAFGVILRCQPSLEILQHVAIRSWSEPSREVASYVTSTLETFGNSSLPCMQLTADRIQKVMSYMKRSDIGMQHAKNFIWTYFDDLRDFGLEHRCEYIPSNESFIPSMLYKSLSYSTDSLKDVLIQMALNVEGLTQQKIFKYITTQILGLNAPKHIPENIFGNAKLVNRVPDMLRFTIYRRIFYSSSYYYFDLENFSSQMAPLKDYLKTYLRFTENKIDGQLVKVILPSTFHTVTIAKTLPYPVEFEMQHPLVLALKIKSLQSSPTLQEFNFQVRPSIYYTKLYTHQLKNVGDCKEIGVYHQSKIAVSLPFIIKSKVVGIIDWTLRYSLPELQRTVFTYFSESGTFAGQKSLETLPYSEEREPITTIPSPFKHEKKIEIVGMPPLEVNMHTEDISVMNERLPRNAIETLDYAVRKIMNAGWRRKSINITIEEDSNSWPRDTEVTFSVKYGHKHYTFEKLRMNPSQSSQKNTRDSQSDSEWIQDYEMNSQSQEEHQWNSQSQEESQSQWHRQEFRMSDDDLKPSDISDNKNPDIFINQGKINTLKFEKMPHMEHTLKISVETNSLPSSAFLKMVYNHTYNKIYHGIHVDASVISRHDSRPHAITLDHFMGFIKQENEFKYKATNDHFAVFVTGFNAHQERVTLPWENITLVTKGVLKYESLENLLKNELEGRVNPKDFLPETHEECLNDIRKGNPQSLNCIKALREQSIYNKMKFSVLWKQNLPQIVRKFSRRADLYLKHFLFHHLTLTGQQNAKDNIIVDVDYIDKFTDEPVIDMKIRKPTETIQLRRIPTGGLRPLSSTYTLFQSAAMDATNNTYPPTCTMMKNFVRTYDQKTYNFHPEKCDYVLSTHCTPDKYFAITVKAIDISKGTKEVHMYVGDHILILKPLSKHMYEVLFNGKSYQVFGNSAVVFEEQESEIYAFIDGNLHDQVNEEDRLHIIARQVGVSVVYDGVNVKIQVDPWYKGELCGLCSEFNGEQVREFRGLDSCLYTHRMDFANSALMNRGEGTCAVKQQYGDRICENDQDNQMRRGDAPSDDEFESMVQKNVVLHKESEYCFSIVPVPTCSGDVPPGDTEPKQIAFHCLPRRDTTAAKMLADSRTRVLSEIARKSVDFEQTVQIAKRC